jgi:hypothetical protein
MQFYRPQVPFSWIDAHNRMAAATGSLSSVSKTMNADYNGHRVYLEWNGVRKNYHAYYYWCGHRTIAKGKDFKKVLTTTMAYFEKDVKGSVLYIRLRDDDTDSQALLSKYPEIVPGTPEQEKANRDWFTWKHKMAQDCVPVTTQPFRRCLIFDPDLLEKAVSRDDYVDSLRETHGHVYR